MQRTDENARPARVLLTSVCRPFGGLGEGDSVGAELFHAQVTRAQGPFSLRQTIRVWGLDYIAENLKEPTVTLHYPSRQELIRELKKGRYTHVGINFVVATFHKVREMVPLIRRYAPDAKIVLGGYGTVLPDSVLTSWADAICREEGIGFMRKLLGETPDAPVRHPHAPIPSIQTLAYQLPAVVGHVTAGLGCSNGCDFCCTSHFFKQKYKPYLRRGRDIYEAMMATRERARRDGERMGGFIIIDEDFFLHHRRAREFLDCVREGESRCRSWVSAACGGCLSSPRARSPRWASTSSGTRSRAPSPAIESKRAGRCRSSIEISSPWAARSSPR